MKSKTLLAALLMTALATWAFGASDVDSDTTKRYAWGENIGWCDLYADGTNGVEVQPGQGALSGYIWCENVGWLHLGDGSPDTPPSYSNASATDFGS